MFCLIIGMTDYQLPEQKKIDSSQLTTHNSQARFGIFGGVNDVCFQFQNAHVENLCFVVKNVCFEQFGSDSKHTVLIPYPQFSPNILYLTHCKHKTLTWPNQDG